MLDAFRESGGRRLDTARVYGTSEQTVGSWLAARAALDDMQIVTKGAHPSITNWAPRLSTEDVKADVKASLAALGVSAVDCYLLHRDDPATPVEDIAHTLADVVGNGYAASVGVSNWTPTRVAELVRRLRSVSGQQLAAVSNYGGLAVPTAPAAWPGVRSSTPQLLRLAHREDFQVLGWSSLSAGYFTDDRPHPEFAGTGNDRRRTLLRQCAAESEVLPAAVLIRTLATEHPSFVPVFSTRSPDRVRLLCTAAEDVSLDDVVAQFRRALQTIEETPPNW